MNAARSVLGGTLLGYVLGSFFSYMLLSQVWAAAAPIHPNTASGLVYVHNQHGSLTYFSQFQATAGWLMITPFPLCFVGFFLIPHKKAKGVVANYEDIFKIEDDPTALGLKTALVVGLLTPVLIVSIGPYVVRGMNAAGFVRNLG